jgi:hypothetical protein
MVALSLLIPPLLLAFLLIMDRVEQPLRDDAVGDRLAQWLEEFRPDEVEALVSEGFAPTLDRYWRRRRIAARLPRRSGAAAPHRR